LAKKAENELAPLATWHDPHGVVHDPTRRQFDLVIHHTEFVWRSEADPDLTERRIRHPRIALLPDVGPCQPSGPLREIARVGGKLIHLVRIAADEDADMANVVVHGSGLRSFRVVRFYSTRTPPASPEMMKWRSPGEESAELLQVQMLVSHARMP